MSAPHISDKYEVLEQIGRGGMGVVYRTRHRALQTILAVKVLPPELAEHLELVNRFHQEARLMAQLRHPHIVQVVDVDKVEDLYYFIMEYIAGKSLSQHLREQGPLSLLETLGIARQIASALEYAHTHEPPVIHRDIKPDNILLESSSGRVVVTDFGIAKVLGASGYTSTDLVLGTLLYCAPEQVLRPQELDGRADLYALGMVMYEMVTGRPFFSGLDERALLGRALYGPEENLPTFSDSTPPEFAALVTRAIARDPAHRYQQATDLRQDIEHCLALCAPPIALTTHITPHITPPTIGVTPQSYTVGPFIFPKKEKKRRWILAAPLLRPHVILLCVVLLVIFFFGYKLPYRQVQSPSLLTRKDPQQAFSPRSEAAIVKTEGTVTSTEPVAEKPVEKKVEAPLASHSPEQETLPPRQYRVTTLTVVRDRPTWKGAEVALLKPHTKIQVVALSGNWLKVASRTTPPKPPGYVWHEDAKPE